MKYAIIIPDGAADDSIAQLNNRTPLQAAHIPNMDRVANMGLIGTARTVPDGFESGSDVATMSLLGYDPVKYHTGRAPLEAAAQSIPLSSSDWVFRCNLVTIINGVMKDHSAGGISDSDARIMLKDLADAVQYPGFEFYAGVSYRNLLVYRGKQPFHVTTKPPHEMLDDPIETFMPQGPGSDILRSIIKQSERVFEKHSINHRRTQTGANPVTHCWLWGQGHPPAMPKFLERFGIDKGVMITGVDLLRGLAVLLGWSNLNVPGMTSFHDTDYAAQGKYTCDALDQYDIVVSHIESPDEASHQADLATKIAAIESIDKYVVGPVLEKLRTFDEYRLLVLPDHPTNIATRKHGYNPTLFAMCGTDIKPCGATKYDEPQSIQHGRPLSNGHDLMELFLRGK